ncbi:MFS transporter [Xanthomonas vesicatoria]|uniref:MFS transporter n=1 Tax=Xanthomonas vesicatoria TaxID=56460 RepID=UPI000732163F|nr:MFS transporter [Xanthomonas vesicatoria]KTF34779.1 MFS transporter [Xanthomonas vesicatoria]MCC8559707.1 MFS transporter [Xanthomonas vesicatoria]MCC8602846.1 MFS transporter [Xanthomonas vesicatoria]MCC8611210.1 MFS transporter [Xanthomonas vesicatoria]MCC8675311.1 MFS transporter [Xanthomonas vesicatoria]
MTSRTSPRAEQHATRAAFFIPGFAVSIWAPLVPFAKQQSALDEARLGLVLLCLGAGSLMAMPVAGAWASRAGFRRVMLATVALMCVALPCLSAMQSALALGAMLFVFGAGVGAMDCTMNMQAVAVERDSGKVMMSGFHAFYSIGGFAGALLMTVLLSLGIAPTTASTFGALTVLIVAALAAPHWRAEQGAQQGPLLAWPRGSVLFIGILAFVVFLAEGTILDWSAVFLTQVRSADATKAGAGYVIFALTMTATRLFGDALVERMGRIRSIMLGGLGACAGFLIAVLTPWWQLSLLGYALIGLGCANIAPALFSMAGQQRAMPEGMAITAMTTLGYAGVLAGPALIGFAAQGWGLTGALMLVAAAMCAVAISARWLQSEHAT